MSAEYYRLAADAVMLVHSGFVAFVVFGLLLTWVGAWRGWAWVRNRWFRWIHLMAIGFVVVQTWLGQACPLTDWEHALRQRAGDASYEGDFIAHWVESLLYWDLPSWVFTLVYSLFGLVVAATWYWVRPGPVKST